MIQSPVPLFLMEEHHEAFLIWNLAIQRGTLPGQGSTLLHIDEHGDDYTPRLTRPLETGKLDIKYLHDFTYNELTIGTWLITTYYQGIFSHSYWIRPRHEPGLDGDLFLCSHEGRRQHIHPVIAADLAEARERSGLDARWCEEDTQRVVLRRVDAAGLPAALAASPALAGRPLVVDIDLDYFSCNVVDGSPLQRRLEISAAEYLAYCQDRFHPFRLYAGQNIRTRVERAEGSWWMIFEEFEEQPPITLRCEGAALQRRLDELLAALARLPAPPALIDVCRSTLSGYTPPDQAAALEELLLEGLRALHPLDEQHVGELLGAAGL